MQLFFFFLIYFRSLMRFRVERPKRQSKPFHLIRPRVESARGVRQVRP